MSDLATNSLNGILSGQDYYVVRGVPLFDVHKEYDDKGKMVDDFTPERLERLVAKSNRRAKTTGDLSPFGPGHTTDDDPEEDQPPVWGYVANYRVGRWGPQDNIGILADFYVRKRVSLNGRPTDGLEAFNSFPRRSIELWDAEDLIDWVALLRRTPERDLGLALVTAGGDGARLTYMKSQSRRHVAAVLTCKGKRRYSRETHNMADNFDPTQPADADQVVDVTPDAAAPDAAAPDAAMSDDDKQTAEKYAKHVFGMHSRHARALMQHLHKKYGKECGLGEDMNQEPERYEREDGKGFDDNDDTERNAAMARMREKGELKDYGPAGGAPGATDVSVPGEDQEERMKRYQADIQKNRYSKLETENAALLKRVAALETSTLHAEFEAELVQMQAAGYPVDPVKELAMVKTKRYSRERFREHVETVKRFSKAAPVGVPNVEIEQPNLQPATTTREQAAKAKKLSVNKKISFDDALAEVKAAG